jgi:hypothetical protein
MILWVSLTPKNKTKITLHFDVVETGAQQIPEEKTGMLLRGEMRDHQLDNFR